MARFEKVEHQHEGTGGSPEGGVTIESSGRGQAKITVRSGGQVQSFTVPRTPLVSRGVAVRRAAG